MLFSTTNFVTATDLQIAWNSSKLISNANGMFKMDIVEGSGLEDL